ncbi:adenine phosphoribosyltransferase, partial [Streptomyces sp. SID7499]|nr:adenine phosphoribosyltransferase [Streptomyces sp. SID7499]
MTSTTESIRELLLSRIRDVADYPKPGVMFKDIT